MPCPTCKAPKEYNEHWDADFCRKCDKWLSEPCGATTHKECPFECWRRPEKPSLIPASYIIGADEVGRGCLAGPLCVGAVMVLEDTPAIAGVTDSKALSPKRREVLSQALKDTHQALAYIPAKDIDRDGIMPCLKRAFKQAIIQLLDQRTDPERHTVVLVDGVPMDLNLGDDYESDLTMNFLVKGDALDWRIGAASIIAKVARDRMMAETCHVQFPAYSWDKNKGYGTPDHLKALREHGVSPLHRKTFCQGIKPPGNVLDMFK